MLIISGAILMLVVALGGLWFWLSRETEHDRWLERFDSADDYE